MNTTLGIDEVFLHGGTCSLRVGRVDICGGVLGVGDQYTAHIQLVVHGGGASSSHTDECMALLDGPRAS